MKPCRAISHVDADERLARLIARTVFIALACH